MQGGKLTLNKDHHHHLIHVLRYNIGDIITLFDELGYEARGEIVSIEKESLTVLTENSKLVDREPKVRITMAFALSKGQKPEFVLQKCTEIGVSEFLIFPSERSIVRLDEKKIPLKIKRWKKVMESACMQSGRAIVPKIDYIPDFAKLLLTIDSKKRYCPDLRAKGTLLETIKGFSSKSAALLIGPEGGLTEKEMKSAENGGFERIKISNRILRSETAAIVAAFPFTLIDFR